MPHLPLGTFVRIKNYHPLYNGRIGGIVKRDGEYYTVNLGGGQIVVYLCEMEELKNETN